MNLKTNPKFLALIVIIEILYFYVMYFFLLFSFFLYFGSGAGSESETAINSGKIANLIIILPPIIYNFFRIYKLKIETKSEKRKAFIIATIIYIMFLTYQIYCGIISL
ncbi:hypothetical protein Q361_1892 [Flavobacterium croceum DSM 17960]|uniref:DUF1634 domain-containing protein n=1 Tax=Flavobacterium croceum DSM 17960 TaxID=1121886 RepID=A0A2S4N457_9FLAO|nr:hypothetical protein Q361_1892 [Flavobacterium croceum DSM 17960]